MPDDRNQPAVFHIHLGDKGGAENFFVRLVQAFSAKGVRQAALTRPDRVWHPQLQDHCDIYTETFSSSHIKRALGRRRINKRIEAFNPDIVMAWMTPATRWVPTNLPGLTNVVRLGDFPDKMEPLYRCHHIVGNTPEIIDRCVALGWPKAQGHVISNFVDPVEVQPAKRAEIGVAEDSFFIVALGRFVERKGFSYLLDAVAKRPDVSVCLLGDGPLKAEFEAQIKAAGMAGRVVMPGWVDEPQRFIRAADCLCCPSLEEPLGNVVLEGWASQVPVIAADSEGPSWLIEDGKDGILCEKANGEALGLAIDRLRQEIDSQAMVRAARDKLDIRFSQDAIVKQYLDFFKSVS